MGQGKSAPGDRSARHSVSGSQKKQISLENMISPNGFMPPELIFSLMNMVDFDTYRSLAITCKLYYETAQTTIYGSNLSLVGANMMKGYWWTETLSNRFSPKFNFSYVASFQGNKVIVNNHHINPTSYGNYKFYKGAFMVDLVSNERTTMTYGSVFANDYIVRTLREGNDDYFAWDSLEVLDKQNQQVLHKIERKLKPLPPDDNGGWGYSPPPEIICLHVNQKPGENSILLVNTPFTYNNTYDEKPEAKMTIEVYNLKSAKMTSECKVTGKKILGYYGNHVIVGHKDKVTVYNMSSNKESMLTSDAENPAYFIHDDEIAVRIKNKIKFINLETHKETREVDITPHIKSLPGGKGNIRSIAFDKTKLVVGINLSSFVHFVIGIASGNLLATLHCPYDKVPYSYDPQVHLTPNGKIITDASNLIIYDFSHPNANPELKVPVVYFKEDKVQQTQIKLPELKQFAAEKLNTQLARLNVRTLNNETGQVRVTIINVPNSGAYGDHNTISRLFMGWEADQLKRSAWALTTNDPKQISADFEHNSYYGEDNDMLFHYSKECVLVFEQLNSKNNRWEFCKPTGIDTSLIAFE